MDVRDKLRSASQRLLQGFRESQATRDRRGKGTQRESFLAQELRKILPSRYSFGTGEVVTWQNAASGELDVVIYDETNCPRLLLDEAYTVFPYECVFGTVQVKTTLDATELRKAYDNIRSVKEIIPQNNFVLKPHDGMAIGVAPPNIVGAVFAYQAGRSLEAIADQVRELDASLPEIRLRPDFIGILDVGLVGPREPIRGEANLIKYPSDSGKLAQIRRTGDHTWMRFCLQLTRELQTVQLPPLSLTDYLQMPELVGGRRVAAHDRLVKATKGQVTGTTHKVNAIGIQRIVDVASNYESTWGAHFANVARAMGESNPSPPNVRVNLNGKIRIFNPRDLPLFPTNSKEPYFMPWSMLIDGIEYLVDVGALRAEDLDDTGVPVDDLLE